MALMRTPRTVDIAITSACNLRCRYCSHFMSAGDTARDLPKEEWFAFFEELNRSAVMNVILCGGEPFHRNDLKDLVEAIVMNRMRFSILTNGTLITEEQAGLLASTRRCDYVQVSIDGSIPTTHDSMRGEGSFKNAVEGIRILKRHKINVAVRVTIHRQNLYDLENIAHFLLEEIGLSGFGTNSASYMGLCRRNREQVQLTAKERCYAMEVLLRLDKAYNGRIQAAAGPLAEARMWLKMERARQEGRGGLQNRGALTACAGMMNRLAVRADGVIVPCIQLSHIGLGRINEVSFKELWQNHPELNRLRQRRDTPLTNFEFCRDCEYVNYCTGNCPALAYTLSGEVNHPSPDACLKRFLEEGGQLPEERLLHS